MPLENLPILDPLSKATERKIQPIRIDKDDLLSLCAKDGSLRLRVYRTDGCYPSWAAIHFLSRIPEIKSIRPDRAVVGLTDITAVMINSCWPKDRLRFEDSETELIYTYLLTRFLSQTHRSNIQAKFKLEKTVPAMPEDYVEHPEFPQSDYQKVGTLMALGQEGTASFCDRGTGKTNIAINRICLEATRDKKMMRVLIVCPKKARLNWFREVEKFTTCTGKVSILRGVQINRLKIFTHAIKIEDDCEYSLVIVSYDTMASDVEILKKAPWDLVIADESHYFKSSSTKRWKAIRKLREVSDRRMILTGTPISNSIFDLYTQFEFLGEGLSGFSSQKAFKKFHWQAKEIAGGQGVSRVGSVQNIPLLQERLARISYAVTKEEAGLNLPDKVRDVYECNMLPKQQDFYTQMCTVLAIEIKRSLESGTPDTISANHILTRLLRLSQITSGFVKYDARFDELGNLLSEGRVEQIEEINNPKLAAVEDMIKEDAEDPNAKGIIWSNWIEDIEACARRLNKIGVDHRVIYGKTSDKNSEKYEHEFNNDPNCKWLVANPKKAGDSLNLLGYNPEKGGNSYCNHMIYYCTNWSSIEREQSEDRSHRRGTKMPLRITDLVIPGTIDEEIRDRVSKKIENAKSIQDIRSILETVLNLEITL